MDQSFVSYKRYPVNIQTHIMVIDNLKNEIENSKEEIVKMKNYNCKLNSENKFVQKEIAKVYFL